MEAVSILCLFFGVPVIAAIVTAMMLQSRDRQLRRLELQVLDLHDRLMKQEATPAAPVTAPQVPLALGATSTEPASPEETFFEQTTSTTDAPELEPVDAEAPPTGQALPPSPASPPEPLGDFDMLPEAAAWQRPSAERIAVWIGAVLGAFTLAVGGLFAIVAAVEAGWLGPGFRVGGAMAFGTLAWVTGGAVRSRSPMAASALSGAGAATIFGAVWAATDLYALIPVMAGFTVLVGVVGVTLAYAARVHDRFLANLALFGGLLASVVVAGTSTSLQLAYALMLNVAMALLCSRRPWSELLLIVGAGTALQLVGLTTTDRVPEQQLFALMGIAALLVPHAAVAARSKLDAHRVASVLSAAMILLLAAAWVPSLSDTFYDPRSGYSVVSNPSEPWEAAVGFVAILLPLWLAGRVSKAMPLVGIATVLALPSLLAFAIGWYDHPALHFGVPLAMTVGLLVLFAGQRKAGEGLVPWFPAVAFVFVDPSAETPAGIAVLALLTISALVMVGSVVSTTSLAPVVALPAVALAAIALSEFYGLATVGPAIAVMVVIFSLPIARRWDAERFPALPWIAAVVAPTAFMPSAYIWWEAQLGTDLIGVLPLLVAFWTLLLAAVLIRRHRVSMHSATFSIGVLAVLGGITLALPLQLQERWLTVGWALEGALLAWLSLRLKHPLVQAASVGLGVTVAVRLLLNPWALSWGDASGWPILNWTLYTWGIPTVCLLISAHFLTKTLDERLRAVPVGLRLLAMLTGFAMLNVQVSHAFQDQGALSLYGTTTLQGMARSITWGGYGLFLLIVGLLAKSRATRFLGFGFILLSALKVFLLDVWSLPGMVRVGSLVGLGLFLLVSAFLFERLVLRERSPQGE